MDNDASILVATEVVIRPTVAYTTRVAINEVKLIGREENALLSPVIMIDPPLGVETRGGNKTYQDYTYEMAAEVINMERNILITGDHEDFYDTREGMSTAGVYDGVYRVSYARVEYCGQDIGGFKSRQSVNAYCMHLHHLSHCPDCLVEGNAIEHMFMAGINLHDTHDALVHRNVVLTSSKVRGSFYTEDGNEINNTLSQNVAICASSRYDQCGVGYYLIGMHNIFLENHAAGYAIAVYTNGGGSGQGPAAGLSCPIHTPFLRFERNVLHDSGKWSLYLGNLDVRNPQQDVNGFVRDRCVAALDLVTSMLASLPPFLLASC